MTTWQTEMMEEQARNQMWEDLNAPDPCEKILKEAALDMRLAMGEISKSENYLYDAVAGLSETPMADKVQSLVEEMLSLHSEIERLAEKYGRGQRE